MCNLYSITTAVEAMRNLFEVSTERDHLGNAEPLDAVWPKYPAPVVRLAEGGGREMLPMSWGFLTEKTSKKTGTACGRKSLWRYSTSLAGSKAVNDTLAN